ncbi:MAG: GNAT family N-acetyltransferase, partial [Parvibaculaceae bacterium]
MDIALNLALLDFEEVALLLLATSWLLGTRALGPLKPLARGEEFRTVSGIEVASFRSDGNDSLFNGRAWSAAAAGAAMAKGCELQACGLWQEGELRLSLALRLERWSGVTLAFPLTDPLAQYSDLQGEGDALGLLERTVRYLARSTDARALVFFRVRSGTALAEALDRMGAARLRSGQAPYIDLARHASHEAWLASFGATTRKSRRQRRRRLETRGTVAFQAITAGAEAGRAAQAILVLKRNWMRANGLKSRVLDDPHWSSALAEIISSADSNAVVSCLTLDGKLIAGEIGFVAEGDYFSYLGADD